MTVFNPSLPPPICITRKIRRFEALISWPCARLPIHSLGMTSPTLTAPAPRLMNCLLLIAIALLLVQLELRQAHDLMNETANLLINRYVIVHVGHWLPVVACFEIGAQRSESVANAERPEP